MGKHNLIEDGGIDQYNSGVRRSLRFGLGRRGEHSWSEYESEYMAGDKEI